MSEPVVCPTCGTRNRVPSVSSGSPRCARCKAPLAWIVEVEKGKFDEVVASRLPVLIDFWAPWCAPCKAVSPVIAAAAAELAGRLKVVKVNVDEHPELAARFAVQGIPTLLLFHNGRPIARQVGALGGVALRSWLDEQLAGSAK